MTSMHLPCLALLVVGLFHANPGFSQSDIAREKRLAAEIVDMIFDGEPVYLEADGHSFLSIDMRVDEAKGSVLILHGRGFHPNWAQVVYPLRVGLAERGWNTLSIQLPVLAKDAKYNEYVEVFDDAGPRMNAALEYLHEFTEGPVVIIAHSCGSHMAQHWILNEGKRALPKFNAFVGIGMGATDYKQPMVEPYALDKMDMPILDVYGEDEYNAVIRMAPERLALIKKGGNPKSKQMVVEDADHFFTDKGDDLLEVVGEWLDGLLAP